MPLSFAPLAALENAAGVASKTGAINAAPLGNAGVLPISRIDNVYGDRHLFCSCWPMDADAP